MDDPEIIHAEHDTDHGSLRLYITGFALSILFTLTTYVLVEAHVNSRHQSLSHPLIITLAIVMAIAQFMAQLYCFLHLGRETKPRWKLLLLACMIIVVFILVFGSLWIMYNLNYRMTPNQINTYMKQQDGGL